MTVASIDYVTKRIYLDASTVDATLDTIDVYKEVRALRRTTPEHQKYKPIIIAGGHVQKTATTYTPAYVQLLYGCRIVPYDGLSHNIILIRETFTDNNLTGRACFDRTSLSPSIEIDIDVQVDSVEIRTVATSGNEYTLVQISDAVRENLGVVQSNTYSINGARIYGTGTDLDPFRGTP